MTISSERARLVLERYKRVTSPARADKARLLEIIQRRGRRGDLPQLCVRGSRPPTPRASSRPAIWGAPLAKVGLVFAAAVLSAIGVYQMDEIRGRPKLAKAVSAETASAGVEEPLLARRQELAPAAMDSAASLTLDRKTGLPRAASASEQTIDEEVKLVSEAHTALRSGDSRRALQLLGEHARRFPNGKLANARIVEHMIVLCAMGSVERARSEADRFLASNPSSPFAERVKDICAPSADAP